MGSNSTSPQTEYNLCLLYQCHRGWYSSLKKPSTGLRTLKLCRCIEESTFKIFLAASRGTSWL